MVVITDVLTTMMTTTTSIKSRASKDLKFYFYKDYIIFRHRYSMFEP
jgi:hypothetical protein